MKYSKTILMASVAVAALMGAGPAMADDGYVTTVVIDPGSPASTIVPAGTYDPATYGVHAGVTLTDEARADLKGETGAQGIQGVAGVNGTNGTNGVDGVNGTNGVDGAAGAKGDKGDKGDQGIQGIAGTNGTNGAQGSKGDKGDTGIQGVAGLNGTNGTNGAKGDKGDTGIQGVAGLNGTNGTNGAKGDKGDQGIQGVKGDTGAKGQDFNPADLYRGIAVSNALNVPHIDPNKRGGFSLSPGFYSDKGAIGLGAAIRLNDTWQFGGSVASDFDGKNVGGKGVLTGQW